MLDVDRLAAGYGRIPILDGVTFAVEPGEVVGILGHNGMGKSTLMKALIGHLPATAGTVRFDAVDVTREPAFRRARRGLGYVPQGREIFPRLSVLDNLRMGTAGSTGSAADAASAIESVLEDFPALRRLLGRQGGTLSGGEQQMLAIARALCARPRLVLLDEPTEGIQPSIVESIAETLARLRSSRALTLVLVEQNLEFLASLSNRVFVIHRGTIVREVMAGQLCDASFADAIAGTGP